MTTVEAVPAKEIRAAALADLPELREVYRRSSLSNDADRPHLLAHPELLELDETLVEERRVIVAVSDECVVGFASTDERAGHVELVGLFVDPEVTRQGVGRRLVTSVAASARAAGHLRVEVTANRHALDFYEALGFRTDGVAQTRFGDALRMHLPLAHDA